MLRADDGDGDGECLDGALSVYSIAFLPSWPRLPSLSWPAGGLAAAHSDQGWTVFHLPSAPWAAAGRPIRNRRAGCTRYGLPRSQQSVITGVIPRRCLAGARPASSRSASRAREGVGPIRRLETFDHRRLKLLPPAAVAAPSCWLAASAEAVVRSGAAAELPGYKPRLFGRKFSGDGPQRPLREDPV
jgi:hypothetical protein